jgi:dTDP-4-amino-4,6-dideoxygalactose transaminase
MMIPLIDLRAQYHSIKGEIDEAVHRVLESGQFVLGPEVGALERELAAYCGASHAVALASGTDALELALRACGVGPGDEVLTTAYSFIATAEAILAVGAVPVFVDIEPVTYAMDPAAVESRITPKTKAIIPVHLYGHPCDLDALIRIAKAHRLKLIEDAAQAIGAEFRGRRVGGLGDAGCLSFYPSKNLGAYGDGGMLVTSDPAIAERVRLLRDHGSRTRYQHELLGVNSRLDELQAAILRVKLRHLEEWTEARRRHAASYGEALRGGGLEQAVPQERQGCRHVYHLYAVRLPQREQVCAALTREQIGWQIAYPSTLPAQRALRSLPGSRGTFPQAESAAQEMLALPMYPELSPAQIQRIVGALAGALRLTGLPGRG